MIHGPSSVSVLSVLTWELAANIFNTMMFALVLIIKLPSEIFVGLSFILLSVVSIICLSSTMHILIVHCP